MAAAVLCHIVEGLHPNHHCQGQQRDDDGSEQSIDDRENNGPPPFEFEPAPQQRPRQAE
ncbi:MAG TPA: hypothetical protein VKC66_36205 [Xanthobacteraceae bacterium]|nr:hypothetical protein [Xanthobacteraceae bacterium]